MCSSCKTFKSTRWLFAIAILATFCIMASPAAFGQDAVALSAGPVYPSPVIKGQTGLAASFNITNNSSGAVSINTAAAGHKIRYVPTCNTTTNLGANFASLMCGAGDQVTGVLAPSAGGTGTPTPDAVGVSGCNGTAFTFTATGDAAGTIEISSAAPIVLPLGYTCHIAFTFDVLAVPTLDASGAAGIQTLGLGNVNTVDGATLISNQTVTGGGTGTTITTVWFCAPTVDGQGNPNDVCRATPAGESAVCNPPEFCIVTGPSTGYCPDDVTQPTGFVCGATTTCSQEQCTAAHTCLPVATNEGGTCGTQATCESDHCVAGVCAQQFTTQVCRPSTGTCDPAESCTGSSPDCPADQFASNTTACGNQSTCEADHCSGTSAACVPAFKPATTTCGVQGVCEADHCSGTDANCVTNFLPTTTSCNADLCQFCDGAGVCPTTNICQAEACRTPGYFAQHAGEEKSCATNQTSLIIAGVGGTIHVCGEPITSAYQGAGNTGVGHDDSPIEALCQANGGDFRSQVVFQLTAAALNCAANGHLDCVGDTLFGPAFTACNTATVCAASTKDNKAAQAACVSTLDCLNNGGHPQADGSCLFNDDNCHNRNFTNYPDSCAGSQDACKAATKTACTIFGGC